MKQHPTFTAAILTAGPIVSAIVALALLPKPIAIGQYATAAVVITALWVALIYAVMRR